MPRSARADIGGIVYHALNRGNARRQIFFKDGDYQAFLKALGHASKKVPIPVLVYCLMPNHFHLVVWPSRDGELGRFMHGLENAHVRRYHRHYHSSGHLYQGRFKSFPVQDDEHLLTVLRYVELNPVRAGLVERAEQWPWSSARWWREGERRPAYWHLGPVDRGPQWLDMLREAISSDRIVAVRTSVNRGRPFGATTWMKQTAIRLGLEFSLRPRGRPPKPKEEVKPQPLLFEDDA